ncbi:hypothetical protein PN466_02225 [Roseofilum reptotaenium CS-1145]|uniref:Uncharacterized protein n=1 Tax=Roseofilum reptotaenium AO1-A TaxID=1925591 RepID=A0A1L9QPM1_9CYAN|nr:MULTISPECIES: hypothetical protein [Roseofilum]MBP0030310.1 hypothetical protein [Roseofilum sp. Guam]MDB9515774.1 hypothetical protein [Roseofilum reptotaenium CS-1145]OJJ24625.1 hypothetical protein BI308_15850 [Roseofilum reptotaenium AO1-A]
MSSQPEKQNVNSLPLPNSPLSTLDILKESGLIGCISAEPKISTHYKFALQEELDSKYDRFIR